MKTGKELKQKAIQELIRLKQDKLAALKKAQRNSLSDIDTGDVDYADAAESPREQLIDEIGQTSSSLDFLAAEIETLKTIVPDQVMTTVNFGALVETNSGDFFVGAASEPFIIEGKKVTGISVNAPIFKKMEGLKVKAEFHFGNVEYVILNIY